MSNRKSAFTVKPFKNRNGVISWRISGWLHGLRIRKNFKDKQDAFTERGALDLKLMQTQASLHSVITSLTEEQVRLAEVFFQRFEDKPHPLAFYADYGLAHYKEQRSHILLKLLHWDGTGVWVLKRLEEGRFSWPRTAGADRGKVVLEPSALALLLDGVDLKKGMRKAWYER